ncbi:MAG: glycosyltransferase [Chloroflexi bacterium]|nr:glycosyltransferase [Chloroflexota bacterium]
MPQLAHSLAKLLDDPLLRNRLGEAGRRKVLRQWTWDRVYGQIRELYERKPGSPVSPA